MDTVILTLVCTLISSGVTLAVCLINNNSQNKKLIADVKNELAVTQAVTDTKLEELTREVRDHNNFAKRMPVVENEIKHIESDLKTLHGYHNN